MDAIRRILILEDSLTDQAVYKRYLEKVFNNIEIITKEKGGEALIFLSNNHVDCVLLDYQLLDMSGLDFFRELIKLNSDYPPTIMLTGEGSENVAVDALKLGIYDYIVKADLDCEMLHDVISSAYEKYFLTKQLKENENKIKHMAYHDHLTGISNRLHFEQALTRELAYAKRNKQMFGVLLLDLDGFKNINDTLGHEVGDSLLKQVTTRFQSILRAEDILARLGGDEFSVLIRGINKIDNVNFIAEKLIRSLDEPFLLCAKKLIISVSIGIAIYPSAGNTISALLSNADKAMYQAKNAGGKNFQLYK